MPGIKKTFLLMPVREGVMLQRDFACWWHACMHSWAPGEGTMDSSFACRLDMQLLPPVGGVPH